MGAFGKRQTSRRRLDYAPWLSDEAVAMEKFLSRPSWLAIAIIDWLLTFRLPPRKLAYLSLALVRMHRTCVCKQAWHVPLYEKH